MKTKVLFKNDEGATIPINLLTLGVAPIVTI